MTTQELAQATKEVLRQRGWTNQAPFGRDSGPLCVFQAADIVLWDTDGVRLEDLYKAMGFNNLVHAMDWNDQQESVEAIYDRLDQVT